MCHRPLHGLRTVASWQMANGLKTITKHYWDWEIQRSVKFTVYDVMKLLLFERKQDILKQSHTFLQDLSFTYNLK